ncbi:MAG TPA: hypothetical protein VMW70_04515 [Burkholderiales bacterium]|nr:hypothetical protein [Burkholderiales bacterium]
MSYRILPGKLLRNISHKCLRQQQERNYELHTQRKAEFAGTGNRLQFVLAGHVSAIATCILSPAVGHKRSPVPNTTMGD